MASRTLPKLLRAAGQQQQQTQRTLSSIASTSASAAASNGVRKTANRAALAFNGVASKRYAHSGETSEYMVGGTARQEDWHEAKCRYLYVVTLLFDLSGTTLFR